MAFIDPPYAEIGTEVEIEVRNRKIAATIVEQPFYKKK